MAAIAQSAIVRARQWLAVSPSCVRSISSTSALAAPLRASAPLHAPKKAAAGPAAAVVEEKYDLKKQIPVNLLKEGPEPEYKDDKEYPDWVFKLTEAQPILEELVMRGLENVPHEQMKRVIRLASKRRIKKRNAELSKSG